MASSTTSRNLFAKKSGGVADSSSFEETKSDPQSRLTTTTMLSSSSTSSSESDGGGGGADDQPAEEEIGGGGAEGGGAMAESGIGETMSSIASSDATSVNGDSPMKNINNNNSNNGTVAAAAVVDPTMGEIDSMDCGDVVDVELNDDGAAEPTADGATISPEDEESKGGGGNSIITIASSKCPRWSLTLSTPTTLSPLLTPASDISSLKSNLHGLGLRHAADRARSLSRAGKGCSSLLFDVAALHDELSNSLNKICPTTLESAGCGTPMMGFASDVNECVSSFAMQVQSIGATVRNDVSRPYRENSADLSERAGGIHARYAAARARCARERREALKLRKKYSDSTKEAEGAVAALGKARAARARRGRRNKKGATTSTAEEGGGGGIDDDGDNNNNNKKDEKKDNEGRIEISTSEQTSSQQTSPPPTSTTWEEELRDFGEREGLVRQCEAVVRASNDAAESLAAYASGVAAENVAVDDARTAEGGGLDAMQALEEERIVFVIGLLNRLLQDEKESLENMSLDLASVDPLDLADGNHRDVPPVSSTSNTTTTSSALFMSPRRRAQSYDGPAISETRMLNLPDGIAEIRDNMKSLVGRQLGRLRTLKQVAAFNEGMASAIGTFASNLKGLLDGGPSPSAAAALGKNEGSSVLNAWNATVGSLEMYVTNAEVLARRIRDGNAELQRILQSAEREGKAFKEREESRWRSLCDAARVQAKAEAKHKQCVADLEKARARMTQVEGEGGPDGGAGGDGDGSGGGGGANLSPMKQSTKIDRHMNKAFGKMFSILPGGGEDMMNKVLTPQQRQAITLRQLDEAKVKEEKGSESFEVARSVKSQAVATFTTDSEAIECKFKAEERREWDSIQKSLVCCVDALRNFRDSHLQSVNSSIGAIKGQLGGEALSEDLVRWAALTEKRVADQRARILNDSKSEEDNQAESGFSLKVHLVEGADAKELVRRFLDGDDEDMATAEDTIDISDSDAEPTPREINDKGKSTDAAPSPPPPTLPDVPPDPIISKMDAIFSKKLKNVSIDKYYDAGWSEDVPLYGPWLERKGSFDVTVGDWEHYDPEEGSGGDGFENAWSGEKFTQKRIIRFKFKRTTHLYIGPPIAGVTQTQYLVKEGNDKCVVMMTVEMDGIPYADSFTVEVRWSARRVKGNDIAIDAGVFVRIMKSNMFASKIKSGALKETSPIHLDLFEVIKSAIASGEVDEGIDDIEAASSVDMEVEPDAEINEEVTKIEQTVAPSNETRSQVEGMVGGIFNQAVVALSSLSQNQQFLLVALVLYFLARIVFYRDDPRLESIDVLSKKVDVLTNEVREMKAAMERILELSVHSQLSDEL